jgi:hypothetical protein
LPEIGEQRRGQRAAELALMYASSGVPIFPCIPGGKTPLTPHGFHDASTHLATVKAWWAASPQANIATPTGAMNGEACYRGIDVLDVDVRPDGHGLDTLHAAQEAGLVDGWLRAVRTPSGGLHLHYPGTGQRNGSLRDRHVDFRGTGGYVLLPGSVGQCKAYSRRYVTLEQRPGPGRPLDWQAIVEHFAPAPSAPRPVGPVIHELVIERLATHVAQQREGNRNAALFWAACRAVEAGVADLRPLVAAAASVGLTEREAEATLRSARWTASHSRSDRYSPGSRAAQAAAPTR